MDWRNIIWWLSIHIARRTWGGGLPSRTPPISTNALSSPSIPLRGVPAREGVAVQEKLPKVPRPLSALDVVAQRVGVLAGSTSLGERWGFLNVNAFVLERNF